MKKIFLILTLFISILSRAQNESMDSITLAAYMHNVDSIKQSNFFTHDINRQVINAIISLNKRASGAGGGGGGITSLNSQNGSSQSFATGTSGSDFGISSSGNVHTFNIPDAAAGARGLVTTGTQTFAGTKTFQTGPTFSTNPTFSSLTAAQILYAGTSGLVSGSNNFVWDNTNQRVTINGGSTAATDLSISKTLGSALQQFITMTDNSSGKTINIGDGASSGFLPTIAMTPDGTTQNESRFDINANDAGSEAAFKIRLRNLAGSGQLATQPLLDIQNLTTSVFKINVDNTLTGTAGGEVVTKTATQTLTNKRITARVTSVTTSSTPAPSADNDDVYQLTALATDPTFSAPSGTPTNNQILIIKIKDNGSSRTITWNAIYRAGDIALPSATVISKWLYCEFMYNSTDSKWDFVSSVGNFGIERIFILSFVLGGLATYTEKKIIKMKKRKVAA